jgi:pimeloyl-ACP methyl ester carboxylesterase
VIDSRFIESGAGPLHIRTTEGSGDVVLAVHGLGGSARNWDGIAGRLGSTVVAMDLPGFGLSAPRRGKQLDVQMGAIGEVLDHIATNIAPTVTLLGNSMGGLVSEMVALARPRDIDRLVLIAPATPLAPGAMPSDPVVAGRLLAQSVPWLGTVLARRIMQSRTASELVGSTFDLVTARRASISPDVFETATAMAVARRTMPWAPVVFAQSAGAVRHRLVRRRSFVEMVEMIAVPTLLIWGDSDRVVSPTSLRWLASLRPDWDAVEMSGVGHVPMLEAPVATAETIVAWAHPAGELAATGLPGATD